MKMQEIRKLAQKLRVKLPFGCTKIDAVRAIQRAEGNFDCFGRAKNNFCDQLDCLFRDECLKISNKRQKKR